MSDDTQPDDLVLQLAGIVGGALASATVDREALGECAYRIANGPDRLALRLGAAVARATLTALRELPRRAPLRPHDLFGP